MVLGLEQAAREHQLKLVSEEYQGFGDNYASLMKESLQDSSFTDRCLPTVWLDIVWQTHMLMPRKYYNDCVSAFGTIIGHDAIYYDLDPHRSTPVQLVAKLERVFEYERLGRDIWDDDNNSWRLSELSYVDLHLEMELLCENLSYENDLACD